MKQDRQEARHRRGYFNDVRDVNEKNNSIIDNDNKSIEESENKFDYLTREWCWQDDPSN
jgi:hypothetical protein